MPDEDAFLRAIIDNPDDDLPRLVYADWLDEHGDPDRAEFIRVQCELVRIRDVEEAPARGRLRRRQEELLERNEERWLAPFVGMVEEPRFGRGFVAGFMVTACGFVTHADRLWKLAPINWVVLRDAWDGVEKLANCPHLGRVRTLGVLLNQLGDAEAATLFASPYLGQLETLDAGNNRFGSAGAEALAANPALTNLRSLNLCGNEIGSAGAQALAASPYLTGLRELNLSRCRVGPSGVEALGGANTLPHLQELHLDGNPIGTRGLRALAYSVGLPSLRKLHLPEMDVDPYVREALGRRFGLGVCVFD